jgi:hypothetical protein
VDVLEVLGKVEKALLDVTVDVDDLAAGGRDRAKVGD